MNTYDVQINGSFDAGHADRVESTLRLLPGVTSVAATDTRHVIVSTRMASRHSSSAC